MLRIFIGRELPTWDLWCLDASGSVIDLSSSSFSVSIRQHDVDTSITATVTANASPSGTGSGSSDVATLNVAPAAGALDNITTGLATIIVVATSGGLDREFQFPAVVKT